MILSAIIKETEIINVL